VNVIVDGPQGFSSSIPTVWEVTSPHLAIVRLHGRNAATREKKGLKAASDRFNYDYRVDELRKIAGEIKELSRRVPVVQAILNNNYQDHGQRNARNQNTREPMPADQIEQRQPFGAAFDKPDNLSGRDRVPSKGVALSPRCSSPPLLGQMPPSNRTEVRVQLAPPSRRVRTYAISCTANFGFGRLRQGNLFPFALNASPNGVSLPPPVALSWHSPQALPVWVAN